MRFFLTHLGGNLIILGYPWFAAMEPHITWSKGWIDYNHLHIMLSAHSTKREPFTPEKEPLVDKLKKTVIATLAANDRHTTASKLAEQHQETKTTTLPKEY